MEKEADTVDYVTVVSVNSNDEPKDLSEYVTVLKIGTEEESVIEEVLVYRLPGEKLGFGLKFEGGTKTSEFVKRLFIQSCAVNSPASRVQSSWGPLTEGDEILEIDSIPVNSMTRIDCVRCLKDSNVVIKLLIKHRLNFIKNEDLPLVISAEKKRTPPPPPPVPPRKVTRKSKDPSSIVFPPKGFGDGSEPVKTNQEPLKIRLTSPYNSGRKPSRFASNESPEVAKRIRRLSDPPDAEVYIDLFSQESACSLSESDDTGSSISTVVDRLGSFPTTTNSSFAGSLPSTPTPVPKHIDLCEDIYFSNEDYLFTKLVTSQEEDAAEDPVPYQKSDHQPLQPPVNFQDAPLSYGNEDVKIMKSEIRINIEKRENEQKYSVAKIAIVPTKVPDKIPPPPPPRTKNLPNKKNEATIELPRLVDFVPKSNKNSPVRDDINSIELVKMFLESEKHSECLLATDNNKNHVNIFECVQDQESWNEDNEFYSLDWSPSSKLATIGEDEEEIPTENCSDRKTSTPVVIIENADFCCGMEDDKKGISELSKRKLPNAVNKFDDNNMEAPPIYSRQPPDGHEFPDYQETTPKVPDRPPPIRPRSIWEKNPVKNSVRDKIAIFSNNQPTLSKKYVSSDNVSYEQPSDLSKKMSQSTMSLEKGEFQTHSSLDLSKSSEFLERQQPATNRLHIRSMSLIDVSDNTTDRWNQLIEQRRRGMSKLKGLVIPEHISENEIVKPLVDLPEIKSVIPTVMEEKGTELFKRVPRPTHTRQLSTPVTALSWTSENTNTLPKYSPAFKRKTLQLYSKVEPKSKKENEITKISITLQTDPPKSLESLTSPTRSDYSFEFVVSSPDFKTKNVPIKKPKPYIMEPSEYESDNDSALSSSQSSYISRHSPPASPTNIPLETNLYNEKKMESNYDSLNPRLLKPQSVEAINRKNILASAKCRSGRDLKVGSPLIQRKFDENEKTPPAEILQNGTDNSSQIDKTESTANRDSTDLQKWPRKETKTLVPNKPIETKKQFEVALPRTAKKTFGITKAASVTDLRKNFEKTAPKPAARNSICCMNSPVVEPRPVKRTSLPHISMIEPIKSEVLPEKPNEAIVLETLNEFPDLKKEDLKIVTLKPEIPGGSLGVTLAGGADYEIKEITVHKIRNGSIAFRDGRLEKGDKILSINGKFMKGLSHGDSIATLKEHLPEIVIVACKSKESIVLSPRKSTSFDYPTTVVKNDNQNDCKKGETFDVTLVKDAAGLGFSVQGGYDSPQGNVPLVIKKLFMGGAAEKCGKLKADDELLAINKTDVTSMSRIDAWTLMKKLPEGEVVLKIQR